MGLTVKITKQHIDTLKAHRLFTAWVPNFETYLARENTTGWLSEGSQLTFYNPIEIEPYAAIYGSPYVGGKGTMPTSGLCTIGFNSYSHSPLPEKMKVGRYCSIGEGLKVLDSQHPVNQLSSSHFTWKPQSVFVDAYFKDNELDSLEKPTFDVNGIKPFPVLKNDVWVGQNVTLSTGITIGNGAIVAANSVVTKSVPDYAIVGGNPAKIIKYRFSDYQREELLKTEWWKYDLKGFAHLDTKSVFHFLRQWKEAAGTLSEYTPEKLVLPDVFK
ncbi:CatB-related O-acetyltransferase [Alteromonas sp. BMJM2]|uniref:CatB-related O-acetyltransferase n=1 Tax=Alteromonas sp. BMJM2 TaxID=2954241 RepID=UPI0022B38B87|nr:CatB-related O-acetyltransferase [Alteromonas sp. BMJM2]